jgi:hypothetical protein
MPTTFVTRLLRGFIAFVLISALYGMASFIALASFVVWAIGPGPSSRAGSGGLFWLLVVVLSLGFVACQFVGLKMATRKRRVAA